LTRPAAVAVVDECEVTGSVVAKDDGVYAVFEQRNPTAKTIDSTFVFAVHLTPAMSPMSRMMPRPREIKKGTCAFSLEPHASGRQEFLVQPAAPAPLTPAATNALPASLLSPEIWTLTVARQEVKTGPRVGAAVTPAVAGKVVLGEGPVVLASTPVPPPFAPDAKKP
jgi:hypothetical protein